MKILLIEDDEILATQLTDYLTAQNYVIESVGDGKLGLEYVQAATYDLILMDLHLPGEDGIALCRQVRQVGYSGAILLQTTESDSDYKVAGLDAGADDYIVKPFSLNELSARIRALLRRPQTVTAPVLQWGEIQLNPITCQVSYANQPVALSPKEYNLLELFMRNPQRVFNSTMLLEQVWRFDETPGDETVRTHIKRLRQKLKQVGAKDVIENIYGMGYRLKTPATHVLASTPPEPVDPAGQARHFAISAIGQFQDIIFARLAVLDLAATVPVLSEALQEQAQQAAHKLAGALGMFGIPEGSNYSRQLEIHLQSPPQSIDQEALVTLTDKLHQALQQVLPATPKFDPKQPLPTSRAGQAPTPFLKDDTTEPARLLVISTDSDWVQELQHLTPPLMAVTYQHSLPQAQAQLSALTPLAILLDMATINPESAELAHFGQLLATGLNIPVLVMTCTDSFEERLHISRYFTCTFLPRSRAEQVLEILQDTLNQRCGANVRLLAVDDDPMILGRLEQQLPQWGIQVTPLEDPRLLWEALLSLNPDVLLLDVEMPHLSGIQLCQIVRSDSRWASLPILFLSACRDSETIHQIYTAGGDDYIPKPFTEPELVTRIFNRLKRHSQSRQRLLDETPAGLLRPHQAVPALKRDLVLAQHHHQPYCLGMITWDLATPNPDTSDPLQITPVLQNLVHFLKTNLRCTDVITQLHPKTVTVGLYGVETKMAHQRFEIFLSSLNSDPPETQNAAVRFRYGLVTAPEDGSNLFTLQQSLVMRLSLRETLPQGPQSQ